MNLYFDDASHKYYNDAGVVFTSATQLIDKYSDKFDTKKMAKTCARAGLLGNEKYRRKTANQIEREWKKVCDDSIVAGNDKHNFLEDTVHQVNKYNKNKPHLGTNEIYTIKHILAGCDYGRIDLDEFEEHGIANRYPEIYDFYTALTKAGYKIFAETAVYSKAFGVSGRIDGLAIKGSDMIIIDYKTYRNPIVKDAGYFKKDLEGNITDEFVFTGKTFKDPVSNLVASSANKCFIQLSLYANMLSEFGLAWQGGVIFQIRTVNNREIVTTIPATYLKDEAFRMMEDNYKKNVLNRQIPLLYE